MPPLSEPKKSYDLSGNRKMLLVIVLISSLSSIRPTYSKYTGPDHPHEKVKREADEDAGGGRMEGGTEPPKHEYRFIVVFQLPEQINTTKVQCHGVLVAPHIVVTAANLPCQKLVKETTTAFAGMHDRSKQEVTVQSREVCHVEIHPKVVTATDLNSYMIIYLSDPFTLNDYVGTISLPLKNMVVPNSCMTAGWGVDKAKLLHIELQIRKKDCDISLICIDNIAGPCNDFGAPLVCTQGNREFIAGVASKAACGSAAGSYYSSFLNPEYMGWFKEKQKQIPKSCYSTHG